MAAPLRKPFPIYVVAEHERPSGFVLRAESRLRQATQKRASIAQDSAWSAKSSDYQAGFGSIEGVA